MIYLLDWLKPEPALEPEAPLAPDDCESVLCTSSWAIRHTIDYGSQRQTRT